MLSIIIPWFNRVELKEALPNIVLNAEIINGDITIINFGGDKHLLREQVGKLNEKINVIHIDSKKGFNKPIAQNIGAYCTKQEYMFFCDCDILFEDIVLPTLLDKIKKTNKSFATLAKVKESKLNARQAENLIMFGYTLKLKIADGTEAIIVDNEEDASDGTRQAPGILLVKRSDFELIQGYNSRLDGWGWEDQDMICRLLLKAKLKRISDGNAIHISHDDNSRMKGYKNYENRWQSRDIMFRRALDNYNKNDFMGTYLQDVKEYLTDPKGYVCEQIS